LLGHFEQFHGVYEIDQLRSKVDTYKEELRFSILALFENRYLPSYLDRG
jgi:hypothetical protein